VLVVAYVAAAPARGPLSEESRVRWEVLGLKAPPKALDAARAMVEEAPVGTFVLAPSPVSCCLPMLHDHPHPLVSRLHYLWIQRGRMRAKDVRLRERAFLYISGTERSERGTLDLRRALSHYDVSTVCAARSLDWIDETRDALAEEGFELRRTVHQYEIWARPRRGDDVDTSAKQRIR